MQKKYMKGVTSRTNKVFSQSVYGSLYIPYANDFEAVLSIRQRDLGEEI